MHIHEAFKKFCQETNHPEKVIEICETEFQGMLEKEITDMEIEYRSIKKKQHSELVEIAVDRMVNWFNDGHEYHFMNESNPSKSIRQFVSSHRRACVWCVLLKREYDKENQ